MECSWAESLHSKPKRAIEELIQGRQFANQLRSLLSNSLGDGFDGSVPAKDLVAKILSSFTNSLTILSSDDPNEASPLPPNTHGVKQESSEESCRSISTLKDRRGCYKRRKNSQTWTKDTPTLLDDGHAWRKYGQKGILNAKYPRHYYRCTHKFDQGCQATKHVQRIEEDPPKYRTTYVCHHSCKTFLKTSELMFDPSPNDSSLFLSFDNTITNKQNPFFSPSQSVKHEHKEEKTSSDDITHNQSSSSDYLVSPDRAALDSFTTVFSESDNRDVISGVTGEPVEFDDVPMLFDRFLMDLI